MRSGNLKMIAFRYSTTHLEGNDARTVAHGVIASPWLAAPGLRLGEKNETRLIQSSTQGRHRVKCGGAFANKIQQAFRCLNFFMQQAFTRFQQHANPLSAQNNQDVFPTSLTASNSLFESSHNRREARGQEVTRSASIGKNRSIETGTKFHHQRPSAKRKSAPTNPPHNRNSELLPYTWKHRDKGDHGEPRAA